MFCVPITSGAAALMNGSAMLICGVSVEEVVVKAIWLEHQARLTLLASAIGTPRGMRAEDVEHQVNEAFGLEGRWRYYTSLLGE